MSTLSSSTDPEQYLRENVKGLLLRMFGMFPYLRNSRIICTSGFVNLTISGTARDYHFRHTIIEGNCPSMFYTRSTSGTYNMNWIPVIGHSGVLTQTSYSETTENAGISTTAMTSTAFNSLFSKASPVLNDWYGFYNQSGYSFREIMGASVFPSAFTNYKLYSYHYNPLNANADSTQALTAQPAVRWVIGGPTGIGISSYVSPTIETIEEGEETVYVYPFEEVEEDKDTEEEVYWRISTGEKVSYIARDNPEKFLKNATNYILYHGFIKTGHYN
jgi:hypothetical protein